MIEALNLGNDTPVWMLGLIALTGFSLAIAVLSALFGKKSSHNTPPILGSNYIPIGNIIGFIRNPLGYISEAHNKLGRCFTMNMFGNKLTFLIGPEAQAVMLRAGDREVDQQEVYRFTVPVFGNGVVYDAPLKIRGQQLKIAANGLKSAMLKSYVPQIVQEAEAYFGKWGEEGEVNLKHAFSELIILTASRCLMGKEVRENMFEQVASLYHDLEHGITPISIFFPYLPIPAHWRRNRAREEMVRLFSSVIRNRRSGAEKGNDLFQLLIDATYKDGTKLNDNEVTGMLIALLFAGQHTSSITTTWTAMFLLHNPQYLNSALQEQATNIDPSVPLTLETVENLPYLHRCIKEALRLFPPIIFLMRKVLVDLTFENYTIPAGHTIFASPAIGHRLPEVYTNPDKYDPDRFAPDRAEDQAKPFSFIGFGGGLHTCLGEHFAFIQIKTVLSVLFRMYEISLPSGAIFPSPDYEAMVVGPLADNCKVRFRRRKTPLHSTA
eukprot:TRINITY_DN1810_c0_g1_i1.p1 TRINITY_DN1810_c0_g1~~TRINITY_DN1810_c0_g1_i1.p1  ORF type:complete len:494 (-),score=107.30 TRINITY_DN1810_c0_g1_i1:102-1583(-)